MAKLFGITYLVGKIKFKLLFQGPLAKWSLYQLRGSLSMFIPLLLTTGFTNPFGGAEFIPLNKSLEFILRHTFEVSQVVQQFLVENYPKMHGEKVGNHSSKISKKPIHTVDGWNPAPPGMYKTL